MASSVGGNEHKHINASDEAINAQEWVQNLIRQIGDFLKTNRTWVGVEESKSQRLLDYACGSGTVSKALAEVEPNVTFRGLDIVPAQVERYNKVAKELLGESSDRMYAIQGDLLNPDPVLDSPEWFGFDMVVISMALHHIDDAVDMLKRLKDRLREGGVLVVADWLSSTDPEGRGDQLSKDVVEKHGIKHLGFTAAGIERQLTSAGYSDVDVMLHPETSCVPETMGAELQVFFAKGTVS